LAAVAHADILRRRTKMDEIMGINKNAHCLCCAHHEEGGFAPRTHNQRVSFDFDVTNKIFIVVYYIP
jgi:hypothetical protein